MLLRSLRARGFVGPRYEGLTGKLRFLAQALICRTEVVLHIARKDPLPPLADTGDLEVRWIRRFEDLAPFRDELERAYYPGLLDTWRAPFTWGERVALGLAAGKVVVFVWAQSGGGRGSVGWFGPLLDGECRVSRMGVLPAERGRAYLSRFLTLLLPQLFAEGHERVFSEVVIDNEPSLKAHLRTGFKAIGLARVAGSLLGGRVVLWRAVPDDVARMLERLAVPPADRTGR